MPGTRPGMTDERVVHGPQDESQRSSPGAAASVARRRRAARAPRWLDRGGVPCGAHAVDAGRDHRAGAVEFHLLGARRYSGRMGVLLLSDGGVLYVRRRDD